MNEVTRPQDESLPEIFNQGRHGVATLPAIATDIIFCYV